MGDILISSGTSSRKPGGVQLKAVLTPEATPTGDVAGVVLRQQGTLLWDAAHLDGVTQFHGLSQLDDGDVVPEMQSGGLANV